MIDYLLTVGVVYAFFIILGGHESIEGYKQDEEERAKKYDYDDKEPPIG